LLNQIAAIHGTGTPPIPPTSYESIATVTLGSSQSTISFSSIPSTYKHLQIRFIARCSRSDYTAAAVYARFNSDSGSNYSGHYLGGNGSNAFAYGGANYNFAPAGLAAGTNVSANIFSGGVIDLLDYQNTNKYKTVRSVAGFNYNTTGSGDEINLQSGSWRNTAAVTSIDFTLETSANFLANSQFALYGIKG
jgi:hypothetical protein